MPKRYLLFLAFLTAFLLQSCSKKSHPGRTSQPNENSTSTDTKKNDSLLVAKKNDSLLAKNAVAKRKEKAIIPKVISVNDSAAHKSVDGRYYYDVMGHRYWRNNKDGKYYLFNKSMYTNDAFKAPGP
jgi:hypothetical protein